jgi:hypothetical protein
MAQVPPPPQSQPALQGQPPAQSQPALQGQPPAQSQPALQGQPSAPVPAEAPGARTHDGFYLRLGLGGGAVKAEFSGGDPGTPDVVGDGAAVLLDILVGGTPAPGFVLGGGYHIAVSADADFEVGTRTSGSGAALGQGIVGPFVNWFPLPNQGLDIGLLLGMAIVSMDTPGLIFTRGVEIDQRGFGASPFLGYSMWISDEWSLGLSLRATWTTSTDTEGSGQDGMARAFGATFTALYH